MKTKLINEWQQTTLKEICIKITDGTHKTPKYIKDGIPFISTNNLNPTIEGFDFTQYEKYISREEHNELTKRCKPEQGDILVSKCGTIGRTKNIDVDYEFSIFVGLALLKLDKSKVNSKYLELLLNSDEYNRIMNELAPGSTRKTLTLNAIEKIPITLPPLHAQRMIVSILEKAEKLKELRIQADKLTKDYLKSIFLEMFGDPIKNPKKFEVKKIGDICDVKTGGTPDRSEKSYWENGYIPWVKTTEVKENTIYDTEETITDSGLNNSNATIFPKNSIIIAMYGQGVTRGKVAKLGIDASTNQACAVLLPSKEYNTDYLFSLLRNSYENIRNLGRGGNQPNLNLSLVKQFEIILPPIELQEKFALISTKVEKLKDQQKQSGKNLNDLFSALIQKTFVGKSIC